MSARANAVSTTDKQYEDLATNVLKGELVRLGVGYGQLAAKLAAIGVSTTEGDLATKISRGGFSAAFFLQCLDAMGVASIRMN